MMPSGKFAHSSGRHLFPILLFDFLRRSDLLISSGYRLLLLAAKSRFEGYLFFSSVFLPASLIFGVRFLNILSSFIAVVFLIEKTVSGGGSAVFS